VKSLLVEGGSTVIWAFLKSCLVDDIYLYIGPMIVGGVHTPTMADGEGIKTYDQLIQLKLLEIKRLGEGLLLHYHLIP
jgi:2,5-diamino-6-(ribosylamino)-4(3H)-pyrimidinone 5'-phosphate reductase